jgi:FtsP/CotA-like multicopper oxidase with cupredoxin domain
LLNGVGFYDCSKAVPSRPVSCDEDGKSESPGISFNGSRIYRLRVINAGMLAGISIALTDHSMTLIQVDGGSNVVPQTAGSMGVLFPGQRMDVILRWDASSSSSKIQIALDTEAFRYVNSALTVSQEFPLILDPPARHLGPQKKHHFDLSTSKSPPLVHRLPEKAHQTMVLYTKTLKLAHLSNIPHGFLNQTSWKPQSPPLSQLSRSSYDVNQFVPLVRLATDDSPHWLDVVLNNLDEDDHPFHLHGYDAYVLQTYATTQGFGAGWNPFDPHVLSPGGAMNLVDPVRRDTFVVPRRGYVVLRLPMDNPGIWMLHCHVLWHQASGMVMGIEVAGDSMGIRV